MQKHTSIGVFGTSGTNEEWKYIAIENKLTFAPNSYLNIRIDSSVKAGDNYVGRFLILGFVLESHG